MKTDVLIIGAGLAGMSTAYHLRKSSRHSVLVLEKNARTGGVAGSIRSGKFLFDHTGHLLHLHDPYGKRFILGLLKGNLAVHQRSAWIYSHRTMTRYPFQANTYGLPPSVVDDCVLGALQVHRAPTHFHRGSGTAPLPGSTPHRATLRKTSNNPSFHDFALNTFGPGVCRHFMFPYNRKVWRLDLRRLGIEWQGRFIPRPKPEEVLYGALTDQKKFFGYNATFRYPIRGGAQALPDALAARVPGIRLETRVKKVDLRARVAVVEGLGEIRFERLVNTMPLKHFLEICEGLPAPVREAGRRLRYNTVYNLNIGIDRPGISKKHWIYFPEKEFIFYRAGFCSNFSKNMAPRGASSMYIEIARRPEEPFDFPRAERACLDGLRRAGILKSSDRILTRLWIPIRCAYVVYDMARGPAVAKIFKYLASRKVESIGRYGAWKYSFMEEAIMDGKRCAERILGRSKVRHKVSQEPLKALR